MGHTAPESWRWDIEGDRLPHSSRMPFVGEWMLPWLLGALSAAGVTIFAVLTAEDVTSSHTAAALMVLAAALGAAGLVAARSDRELTLLVREERGRPATEELEEAARLRTGQEPYVEGMTAWARAVQELLDHAMSQAEPDHPSFGALTAAADDTVAVLELLGAVSEGSLSLAERATVHAVCSLWETNQPEAEACATALDPAYHRRWRARSVVAARLRHGIPGGTGPGGAAGSLAAPPPPPPPPPG